MFRETTVSSSTAYEGVARAGLQRAIRRRLRAVDYLTCGYLILAAAIMVVFHRGVPFWPWLVMANLVTVGLLLGLISAAAAHPTPVLRFFRDTYPILLYTFMFKEINLIINVIFPFWLENHLIGWDRALFGVHPTVWVQSLFRPWLTEIMAFAYWSYYLLLPLTAVVLYLRRDRRLFYSYVFHLSLTLYTCYLSYLFLGARGPHETLAHLHLSRELVGFFDRFVHLIQNNARISGAAFPSSHVTAVIVAWIFLLRFKRWLGWMVLPLILALAFSVVYLQYHYAVDPIAAIILVAVLYPLGLKLEKRLNAL